MNRFDFRGQGLTKPYFEGWYVKTLDADNDLSIALIPGIAHFDKDESFVQYNIIYKGQTFSGKITFERKEFDVVGNPQTILLPKFLLNEKGVRGSLSDGNNRLVFDLDFGLFTPISQTVISPSIMGPFEYASMPCSHDVISMKHHVKGTVIINGKRITVQNGIGYMEKDRGRTFPKNYVWAQANDFNENNKASFFVSVARIQKTPLDFIGNIAIFHDGHEEHRFASYLGTRVKVEVDDYKNSYTVILKNLTKQLEVTVTLSNQMTLLAPMNDTMDYTIKETIKSHIVVQFTTANFDTVKLTSENGAAELVNWNTL